MKSAVIIFGAFLFSLNWEIAWSKAMFDRGNLSLDIEYKISYDSNILRYSPRDRDRFFNSTETYPTYSSTLDDLRSDFRVNADYRYRLFGGRSGRLSAMINFAAHYSNPINNLGWVSLTARQDLSRNFSLLFNHFYEPYYYIREYSDSHTGTRRHCDFAMQKEVVKGYLTLSKSVQLVGRGEYKYYAYNEYFTEYDGHFSSLGFESIFHIGDWRLVVGYGFGIFNNTGFNASELMEALGTEDTESGNSDFQEDTYAFSVQYSFRLGGRRARIRAEYTLDNRFYTTELPPQIDPIHHAREDLIHSIALLNLVNLNKVLSVEVGSAYHSRDSEASAPIVSEVKDYNRWEVWLNFGYKLR